MVNTMINKINMDTMFKIGMQVYDQILFPDKKGKIVDICEKKDFPIKVSVEGEEGLLLYKFDGRFLEVLKPTLSVKPYKLEGFRQKPTFGDALKWLRDKSLDKSISYKIDGEKYSVDYYYSKNATYEVFEEFRRLIVFRDYFNDGWKPNWKDRYSCKYCIIVRQNEIDKGANLTFVESRLFSFYDNLVCELFIKEYEPYLNRIKEFI